MQIPIINQATRQTGEVTDKGFFQVICGGVPANGFLYDTMGRAVKVAKQIAAVDANLNVVIHFFPK